MRYPFAILVVFALAMTATAQFTISSDQNRIGDMATMNVTGGIPNSAFVVCVDTDPTPTSFPTVGLTVDLGFSSEFQVFEPSFIGPAGTGSMTFAFNTPEITGRPFFAQALNVDPMDIFTIVPSNQLEAIVHGPDFSGGTVTPLTLGDDASQQVALGFSFDFFGTSYTQVFVNANGNLSFGTGNSAFFVQESLFLAGPPCIAPFWCDLNPAFGGTVSTDTTTIPGVAFSVTWSGLPHNLDGGASTATVTLFFNGDIMMEYGNVDAVDVVAGITPGGASTTNAVDLSMPGFEFNPAATSVYEVFGSSNLCDLDGMLVSFAYNNGNGYMSYY